MDSREFFEHLHTLMRSVKTAFSDRLAPIYKSLDLAPSQIGVLRILRKCGGISIGDISAKLGMPDSNISAICRRLEKRGLLERTRDEDDQRVVNVTLTQEALLLLKQLEEEVERIYMAYIDRISPGDKEDIIAAFEKLERIIAG